MDVGQLFRELFEKRENFREQEEREGLGDKQI